MTASGWGATAKGWVPGVLQPSLRAAYYSLYRLQVRTGCRLHGLHDRIFPEPSEGSPCPSPLLRFKVGGTPSRRTFRTVGAAGRDNLLKAAAAASLDLESPECSRILDFGCGCGRILIPLQQRFPEKQFFGADVDSEMIRWGQENLPAMTLVVNQRLPPLPFPPASFDFIYAVSVFTHLDETAQLHWLDEFRRLLTATGSVLLTLHGEAVWRELPKALQQEIQLRGVLTKESTKLKGFFPNWYQTTFHSRRAVETSWQDLFSQVHYLPEAFGFQDVVICKVGL